MLTGSYKEDLEIFKAYAIKAHEDTNHLYDKDLPYRFHLDTVYKVAVKYIHLVVPPSRDVRNSSNMLRIFRAAYGHDLIEDARQTYNDVREHSNHRVADIIAACTCYTGGKSRKDRMPDWIYKLIRDTEDADFVKLCDRIANVKYGIFTESSMPKKYQEENPHFIANVTNRPEVLAPMILELEELFKQIK